MLAYVFWHRPREDIEPDRYVEAQRRFHAELADSAPAGFVGSVCLEVDRVPFAASPATSMLAPASETSWFEDWYLVEDTVSLDVLESAALDPGCAQSHAQCASLVGDGTAGLYRLVAGALVLDQPHTAEWHHGGAGEQRRTVLARLTAQATGQPENTALWTRRLVLGPAPELCMLRAGTPTDASPSPQRRRPVFP
ncbi:MAG: hypothetical protein ACYDD4_12335 [Acidimicrobiales bacterium]